MYTLLKPLLVREELLKRGIHILTPLVFSRIFNKSATQTKYFLEQQTKHGLFIRIKKGLYALKTDLPDEKEIANALYQPSYISFEYALAYYNILAEMPYRITSATTKPTRLFVLGNQAYAYYTIKRQAYGGYSPIKEGRVAVLMADPEKALVDYLYFIKLNRKPENDRLIIRLIKKDNRYDFGKLNKKKLVKFASLFGRKSLISLVEQII